MMERFLRIREKLVAVAENDNSDLQVNRMGQFKNRVVRYCAHMCILYCMNCYTPNENRIFLVAMYRKNI